MRKMCVQTLCVDIVCRRCVQALCVNVVESAFLLEKARLKQQQHNATIILRTINIKASSMLKLASSQTSKL